jgi:hypothetical protein
MPRGRSRQHAPTGRDHRRSAARTAFAGRPYRLIVTNSACKTLAQGEVRHFARIIDAANAFVKAPDPFKTVIYDDGCTARELNRDEQWMLESVCRILGYDVEEVGG